MNAAQLKASILQQAIEGKLVPQLPEEGVVEQIGDIPTEVPFEIPESWKWVQLINTCVYIQRGKSPKYSDKQEIPVIAQKCNQWDGMHIEKAKFIDPQTVDKYTTERWLQDNDLMWNSTGLGTLGRVAIYKDCLNPYQKAVADSHVTVIRTDRNILDPIYLYYYICSNTVQDVIEHRSDGSTKQKELATTTVKLYELPLPPLAEQKRIVAKIEELMPLVEEYGKAYDKLQELNDEMPDKLKASILQEAIQGKLVPQLPEDGVVDQICEAPAEVPFGIPDSWKWQTLESLSIKIGDGLHGTPEYVEDSCYFFINGNNLRDGQIVVDEKTKRISFDTYQRLHVDLDSSTLLLSINGTIGSTAFYNDEKVALGKSACYINLGLDLDKHFLNLVVKSKYFEEFAKNKSTVTTIRNLGLKAIRSWYIPLPPLAEQKRIVAKVNALFEQIDLMTK